MNSPPNFNRLARIYLWMELACFGPWLWWCRCTFLRELADSRRALVIGDGDGRFTARLLRANPGIQIDAVDSSAAMLHSLLRRAGPRRHPCAHLLRRRPPMATRKPALRPHRHPFLPRLPHHRGDSVSGRNPPPIRISLRPVAGLGIRSPGRLVWPSRGSSPGLVPLLGIRLSHGTRPPQITGPSRFPPQIRLRNPKAPHLAGRTPCQRALVDKCRSASGNKLAALKGRGFCP